MKLKVYGTMNCPDTVDALKAYEEHGIEVDYHDIGDDIHALKQFLKLRDTLDVFSEARAKHFIGVPCILTPKGVSLDWKKFIE